MRGGRSRRGMKIVRHVRAIFARGQWGGTARLLKKYLTGVERGGGEGGGGEDREPVGATVTTRTVHKKNPGQKTDIRREGT